MDWKSTKYDLLFPVTIGDVTTKSITLREPDVDALEQIDDLGMEEGKPVQIKHIRTMLVALGDCSNEVIGKMHRDDFAALGEVIAPLLDAEEPVKAKDAKPL